MTTVSSFKGTAPRSKKAIGRAHNDLTKPDGSRMNGT
jgi:hypothetical protein